MYSHVVLPVAIDAGQTAGCDYERTSASEGGVREAHRIRSAARCANTQTTPHAAIGGSDDSCGSKSTDGSIRSPHPLNCTGGFRTFQPPLGAGEGTETRQRWTIDNDRRPLIRSAARTEAPGQLNTIITICQRALGSNNTISLYYVVAE